MTDSKKRIQRLIRTLFHRYLRGDSAAHERKLVEKIYDSIGKENTNQSEEHQHVAKEIWNSIQVQLRARRAKRRGLILKVAATLIPLFIIALAVFHYRSGALKTSLELTTRIVEPAPILTFRQGNTYKLDNTAHQNVDVLNLDGAHVISLAQLPEGKKNQVNFSMTNPTKTPYSLVLNDSTQIWLNRDATIEFESHLATRTRRAKITGEVFFSVASHTDEQGRVPFYVETPLQTIEVLGTEFNVDARDDAEEAVELIEGRIELSHNKHGHQAMLSPGEKAFIRADQAKILVTTSENTEKIKAWKKGLFYFDNESIAQVVNELGRWYDTKIVIRSGLDQLKISAVVNRYETLNEVLELIEMTNHIQINEQSGVTYIEPKRTNSL